MKFLSVCSGIEAASAAWLPLGWEPVAFAEIEPFCCELLAQKYPGVPNLGDIRNVRKETFAREFDLLIGGTPCQGFSVAGAGRGLDDERSGLALEFVRIIADFRPRWIVWENVPGCFSTNGGADFVSFVQKITEIGYGISWRVLDAQFFGIPQHRERVFLVGYSGDYRPPLAVLSERQSVCGNPAARAQSQKTVARTVTSRARNDCTNENLIDDTGNLLTAPIRTCSASIKRDVKALTNNSSIVGDLHDVSPTLCAFGGEKWRVPLILE